MYFFALFTIAKNLFFVVLDLTLIVCVFCFVFLSIFNIEDCIINLDKSSLISSYVSL